MSGLLEKIARRRRASASRRLGPDAQDGLFTPDSNGAAPPSQTAEPEPEPEATAAAAPPEPEIPAVPGFLQRARVRRRARYLRQLRELQLRDIGGFMLESGRLRRSRPDLVAGKLAAAAETDRELRAVEHALGEERPVSELRLAGIGGSCVHCGAVFGSGDRFCSSCGKPV